MTIEILQYILLYSDVVETPILNELFREAAQTNTIIIPPKNIIIKVYINQIIPKICNKDPKTITKKINLKHIIKGDFEITINIKAIIKNILKMIFINLKFLFKKLISTKVVSLKNIYYSSRTKKIYC